MIITKLLIAFFAGLMPALLWLWFWEHEDKHREPKRLVVYAFIAGMVSVIAVIPLEKLVMDLTPDMTIVIIMWAAVEELVKLFFAYIVVLRRRDNDEPIDSMMYMIMVALGFAALENTLFLLEPILGGDTQMAIVSGNLRFIGATLLHTIASGTIGIFLALSFYKSATVKRFALAAGTLLAIVLHTAFNLLIIQSDGGHTLRAFYSVWIAVTIVLIFFEKAKRIKAPTISKPV